MKLETIDVKEIGGVCNEGNGILLENRILGKLKSFRPYQSAQRLRTSNSSVCYIIWVRWTYDNIGIHSTPDCFFSLCNSCCWTSQWFSVFQTRVFWEFATPEKAETNSSEKTGWRRKPEFNAMLSIQYSKQATFSALFRACYWYTLVILYRKMRSSSLNILNIVE